MRVLAGVSGAALRGPRECCEWGADSCGSRVTAAAASLPGRPQDGVLSVSQGMLDTFKRWSTDGEVKTARC